VAKARTLYINRTLRAEPEYVFDAIAHGDALARISGAKVEDVKPGSPAPYGVGAYRIVELGAIVLEEEALVYDRPRRFEYIIRKGRPSFTHHGGVYDVEALPGGGSRVRWKSTLSVDVPVIGPALTFLLTAGLRRGLMDQLVKIDKSFAEQRVPA
jgi:hypothetical protein